MKNKVFDIIFTYLDGVEVGYENMYFDKNDIKKINDALDAIQKLETENEKLKAQNDILYMQTEYYRKQARDLKICNDDLKNVIVAFSKNVK